MRNFLFLLTCLVQSSKTAFGRPFQFHFAPMQGYTDRHLRFLFRIIYPESIVWSEMFKPKEFLDLTKNQQDKLLRRGREQDFWGSKMNGAPSECVLQWGGDNAEDLIKAIEIARQYGYTQYDLNCGCPSIETNAHFGAALMKRGSHVRDLLTRMADASGGSIPISVKCRIGVHESSSEIVLDEYETLANFVECVTSTQATNRVVIHARSAVLQGLSPASNREIPPLRYDLVTKLAREYPNLSVILNGGVSSSDELMQLHACDGDHLAGVMVGRWALQRPMDILSVSKHLFPIITISNANTSDHCFKNVTGGHAYTKVEIISAYAKYAETEFSECTKDEYPCILRPYVLLSDSIATDYEELVGRDDRDEALLDECCRLARHVMTVGAHLLQHADIISHIDAKTFVGKVDSNEYSEFPPFRQFRKMLEVGCGKKLMSKLKKNRAEVFTRTPRTLKNG